MYLTKRLRVLASLLLLFALPACEASSGSMLHAPDSWWTSYGGTFANTRHVDLRDITPQTVGRLKVAWKFNTGNHGMFETSPIVVDGVMYFTTGPDDNVYALDAATGALRWHFAPKVGPGRYVFAINRGVAVDAGRVFITTLDNQLIALDAKTGKQLWDTIIGDPHSGLSEDAAPLAWSGLVLVGSAGNEFGVRGSFSAYSQTSGKLAWRWYAVSAGWEGTFATSVHGYSLHRDIARERASVARYRDAWKNGGGAVWMTPALSPQDGTVYLSTGNPAPDFNADRRPGDNLYTDCVVALDARTGKLKWWYQETPHDVWDYDASSPPVLIDALDASGRRVPAVAQAGKTGWLYVLERKTGRLLRLSQPFVPQPNVYHPLTPKGAPIQPGDLGGAIGPVAYDPLLHSAFVAGNVEPEIGTLSDAPAWQAASEDQWKGGDMEEVASQHPSGRLSAIDTDTGRLRWSTPVGEMLFGGLLSTNGLVFMGQVETGEFRAYDARTGAVLWHATPGMTELTHFDLRDRAQHLVIAANLGAQHLWHRARHLAEPSGYEDIHAPAIAYRMGGREYIAVGSHVFQAGPRHGGDTIFAFTLP